MDAKSKSLETSNLRSISKTCRILYNLSLPSYISLHKWAVNSPEKFWSSLADFLDIKWQQKATKVYVENSVMRNTEWFSDAKLNFAGKSDIYGMSDADDVLISSVEGEKG